MGPSISIAPSLSFLDGGSLFLAWGSLQRALNSLKASESKAREKPRKIKRKSLFNSHAF